MYLLSHPTISEPELVDTSTIDSLTSSTVIKRPTTSPRQHQVMHRSWGTPTPSKPVLLLASSPPIMKPSIVISGHSSDNLINYLTIKGEEFSNLERVASQQLPLETRSTLLRYYRPSQLSAPQSFCISLPLSSYSSTLDLRKSYH